MTSHAAVVARGWGKPCVCGCEALTVNGNGGNGVRAVIHTAEGLVALNEGDWISLNGTTGEVLKGKHPLKKPAIAGA